MKVKVIRDVNASLVGKDASIVLPVGEAGLEGWRVVRTMGSEAEEVASLVERVVLMREMKSDFGRRVTEELSTS